MQQNNSNSSKVQHDKNIDSQQEQVLFEKARLDYCIKIYESEIARKELLERKAQFYLSFVTLFLGSIFFNIEFLNKTSLIITQSPIHIIVRGVIYISIIVLIASILFSIIFILEAIRLQSYKNQYPLNFISSLFSPASRYLSEQNESSLYRANAIGYAIALEINSNINNKKSLWVKYSSVSISISIISLFVLIVVISTITILY